MSTTLPTLRPLRMGEILDRAIRIYRRNFLQFLGIIALVQVPLSLVQLAASLLMFNDTFSRLERIMNNPAAAPENPFDVFGQLLGPGYAAGASLNGLVTILSFILVQGLATAALTRAVGEHYLGTPFDGVLDAFRRVRGEWFSLLGALLLGLFLGLLLLLWWVFVPCVGWISGLGLFAFLWLIIMPLLAPVIILEKQPATIAWRRAWNLARRRFWWVFAFGLVLYTFNLIIVAGPAALISVAGPLLGSDPLANTSFFTVQTVLQAVTTLITSLLYLPLQVAAMTILYVDLRVRTEGVDLLLLAAEEAAPPAPGEPEAVPPLAPAAAALEPAGTHPLLALATSGTASARTSLLTGGEFGNFVLVTVGVFALLLALYGALFALVFALGSAMGAAG